MKVLIVDDSPDAITIARARLAKEEVEIVCAEDGKAGLEAARREHPDLILLDLDMPGMSGFDVCRALKVHPDLCMIPVIFLAGPGASDDLVKALDLGAVDYVTKPFNAFELRTRVSTALRIKYLQDTVSKCAQIDHSTEPPGRVTAGQMVAATSGVEEAASAAARAEIEGVLDHLKAAFDRANRTAIEAEQANRAKTEFLANMSHEIRTPLTAILGYAELVMDPETDHREREQQIGVIRRNGRHLLELISGILDISKIESGRLVLDPRRSSVQAIVADVASMLRVRAAEKHLTLTVEYATALPKTILTDAVHLRQCLINVVGNAVKFTKVGGVTLRVSLVRHGSGVEPVVRFDIIDTGIGIDADALRRLFQPFVQADPSISRKYGGTGLGLTITRRIVEKMGGEMSATSAPGRGSTFTIVVPTGALDGVAMIERAAEVLPRGRGASPAPGRTKPLAGLRVLVVDDGPDNQRLICTLLRQAGAEIDVAENGRAAVAKARGGTYGLILMDIRMPDMDGYQATAELRRDGCPTPIIALTAHALTSDRLRALEAGCTGYVAKPIDGAALIETILRHMGPPPVGAAPRGRPESRESETPAATWGRPDDPAATVPDAIRSEFAADADLEDAIDQFVEHLPERLRAMREAMTGGRRDDLSRYARQMAEAGGSYGYPLLTDLGKSLEEAARAKDRAGCAAAVERLAAACEAVGRGRTVEVSVGNEGLK